MSRPSSQPGRYSSQGMDDDLIVAYLRRAGNLDYLDGPWSSRGTSVRLDELRRARVADWNGDESCDIPTIRERVTTRDELRGRS